jgi:hypothetical protein
MFLNLYNDIELYISCIILDIFPHITLSANVTYLLTLDVTFSWRASFCPDFHSASGKRRDLLMGKFEKNDWACSAVLCPSSSWALAAWSMSSFLPLRCGAPQGEVSRQRALFSLTNLFQCYAIIIKALFLLLFFSLFKIQVWKRILYWEPPWRPPASLVNLGFMVCI